MDKRLTEQAGQVQALDILASALIALPGGEDALEAAIAAATADEQ